ncbi:unnamed protein product [Cuscuta campestris]|uniref:Uncharacterized protein n=1 Tax=Cuscuta campestris TaxID=132261 RepID=A0A484M4T5_9ASTE|nr:unnamed protein product [Cuscuta campestris]
MKFPKDYKLNSWFVKYAVSSHGLNVEDAKKFEEADINSCLNGLIMHVKKEAYVFPKPPLIHWESIKRKFLPKSINTNDTNYQICFPLPTPTQLPDHELPSLTPSLLLIHPSEETWVLYNPKASKTCSIELDFRGHKLVGSSPGGWLVFFNCAEDTLNCYDFYDKGNWHKLMTLPGQRNYWSNCTYCS